jgi:hypothetical protein
MKKVILGILFVMFTTACQGKIGIVPTKVGFHQEVISTLPPNFTETLAYVEKTLPDPIGPLPSETALIPSEMVTFSVPLAPVSGECLPSITNFAYPIGDTGAKRPMPVDKLPPENWKVVTSTPDFPYGRVPGDDLADLEVLQNLNSKDRIWVRITGKQYHLAYYQIDTGYWKTIEKIAGYSEQDSFSPQLFLDQNNTIWIAGNPTKVEGIGADTMLLGTYDESSQQFKSVLALKDLPDFTPAKRIYTVDITHIQMDDKGDLWFFLSIAEWNKETKYRLFKFSPLNHTLEVHLADLNLTDYNTGSLVISPENILYLLSTPKSDTQKASLILYNPANEKIKNIVVPGDLSSLSSLFWDDHQRLWINDDVWLDLFPGGYWNRIIKSPIFIMVMPGSGLWSRSYPVYSLETDDGRLWYSARYRGTGWVDPSTGKWCLFTSHPSNVVRDSEGYLWLIASGKLYRSLFKL